MTVVDRSAAGWSAIADTSAAAVGRDQAIDTIRGIAILMVIGIHSLQQPLDIPWAVAVDAALRPCVPLFLFVSGYLTALSGRVPLAGRLKAALIPYAIAFAAALEVTQLRLPTRHARLSDFFENCFGSWIGLTIGYLLSIAMQRLSR